MLNLFMRPGLKVEQRLIRNMIERSLSSDADEMMCKLDKRISLAMIENNREAHPFFRGITARRRENEQ